MIVFLIFVPIVALFFCIFLALRLYDAAQISTKTYVVGWGPIAGLIWTFAGGVLREADAISIGLYTGVALLLYGAVLSALFSCLSQRPFRSHTIWAILLTLPSLLSVYAWGALQ